MANHDLIRVLLIEDSLSDAELVTASLAEAAEAGFAVEHFQRLAMGLDRLSRGGVDVVLLDLALPDSAGVMSFMRTRQHSPEVPVVVLSGADDRVLALHAVQQGAQDYLVKGRFDGELLVRCLRFAVERSARLQAEQALRATHDEFEVARAIQKKLLPTHAPQFDGFEIAGACQPAAATGGDYFDYLPIADGRQGLLIADVSSHGFGPALIMAGTRRLLRTLAEFDDDVGRVLTAANHAIAEDTEPDQFVSMFLVALDAERRRLDYAAAGHEGYLLGLTGDVRRLPSTGFVLGLLDETVIESCTGIPLTPGEILVLLTDGFQEAHAADGDLFGVQRVLNSVHRHRQLSAGQILEHLFAETRAFCRPDLPADDMTAVVVKVLPGGR